MGTLKPRSPSKPTRRCFPLRTNLTLLTILFVYIPPPWEAQGVCSAPLGLFLNSPAVAVPSNGGGDRPPVFAECSTSGLCASRGVLQTRRRRRKSARPDERLFQRERQQILTHTHTHKAILLYLPATTDVFSLVSRLARSMLKQKHTNTHTH